MKRVNINDLWYYGRFLSPMDWPESSLARAPARLKSPQLLVHPALDAVVADPSEAGNRILARWA